MRRNIAIFIALFAVLTLGLWGQFVLNPNRFSTNFLSALYEVIQLFALEGEWTLSVDLPWQLEAARILAPMVSVIGVLILLIRGAWVQLTNWFIRFWSDHVVVIGLGEKGWQFVQACLDDYRVVVIERDEDCPMIERARDLGAAVIVGDFLDDLVMAKSFVQRARHVVTFCGNDGASVEMAIRIREFLSTSRHDASQRLRIHLHVDATRVSERLESYSKFYHDENLAEVDFFSVYDLTARILLKKYPPDRSADVFGQRQVHLALYGFGRLAEHVLTETVRICHFLNGSRVRFTIFDSKAHDKIDALLSVHPGISELCQIDHIDLPYLNPLQLNAVPDEMLRTVTQHVICLPNDDENLELALMLRNILLTRRASNAPINVRMQHASGLARLLESKEGDPEIPDGIYPFGMLSEVLYQENILSDKLDELARALHEDFLARRRNVDADPRLYTALAPWEDLPEPARKSNRLQADHLAAKLRAIHCRYRKGPANGFAFSRGEAEALAKMEHARWRANKIYEGWRQGLERIEEAKINPFAVPWENLDLEEREEQIEAIARLPELLHRRLGWQIDREFHVGVTGHRPHRLDVTDERVTTAIKRTLETIVHEHADERLILVSPLAEGADRLVARMALDHFGMILHVPLPLPFELYQTDFVTRSSLQEFKELVGHAETYFELPTRFGSIETLASHADGSANEARNRQYALVGAYIACQCDELIAVYDGGASRGTGGTADVVRWRSESSVPEEFRIGSDFSVAPRIKPPLVVDSNRPS